QAVAAPGGGAGGRGFGGFGFCVIAGAFVQVHVDNARPRREGALVSCGVIHQRRSILRQVVVRGQRQVTLPGAKPSVPAALVGLARSREPRAKSPSGRRVAVWWSDRVCLLQRDDGPPGPSERPRHCWTTSSNGVGGPKRRAKLRR